MSCSIIKKLPFKVLRNAVHQKPATLEKLTLVKVCLWLVFGVFWEREFSEISVLGGENFPVSGREFPVALVGFKRKSRIVF